MAETVIVGLDGSEGSRRALEFAIARAAAGRQSLLFASVIAHSPHGFISMDELAHNAQWRNERQKECRDHVLAPAEARAGDAGVAYESRILFGDPAQELATLADDVHASGIVIGRRGLSRIKALLFGSVASSVVQVSPVPVTVVP